MPKTTKLKFVRDDEIPASALRSGNNKQRGYYSKEITVSVYGCDEQDAEDAFNQLAVDIYKLPECLYAMYMDGWEFIPEDDTDDQTEKDHKSLKKEDIGICTMCRAPGFIDKGVCRGCYMRINNKEEA